MARTKKTPDAKSEPKAKAPRAKSAPKVEKPAEVPTFSGVKGGIKGGLT